MDTMKTIFKNLSPGKYIPKDDKTKLEELKKTLIDIKYNKLCEELNYIISKNKLSKKSFETMNNLIQALDDNMSIQNAGDLIEETIKFIEEDTLENTLDKEYSRYMKFTQNNSFSNKFKDDVAKILDELTNNGDLKLVNDDLKLVNDNKTLVDIHYTQTFNNNELVSFIKEIIFKFKNTNWTKYYKKNVMYLFVTTLDDPNNLNRILCKIGFTSDLIDRFRSLEYEYKCKFHLIGVKLVNRVQDEKEFHTEIKIQYPDLSVKMKIGSHDKDEIYVFDINLYKLFLEYKDKGVFNEKELELIKKQNERFNNKYEKDTIIITLY